MIIKYSQPINCSEDKVKRTLFDIENWHLWWPKKYKVAYIKEKEKHIMYFTPAFGITIVWELMIQPQGIDTKYVRGPIQGFGKWFTETNNNEVYLNYNIEVIPKNLFFKTLLLPGLFEKKHRRDMKVLFNSFERFIQEQK